MRRKFGRINSIKYILYLIPVELWSKADIGIFDFLLAVANACDFVVDVDCNSSPSFRRLFILRAAFSLPRCLFSSTVLEFTKS